MKNGRKTKSALLLSVLSLLLCCSMLIGSTFAWFTDSASSTGNKIIAGNLDIELQVKGEDGEYEDVSNVSDLFNVDLWEPGVVACETFKAVNAGNLALKYNVYLSSSNVNYVKDTEYSLKDVLKVAVITKTPSTRAKAIELGTEAGFRTLGDSVLAASDVVLLPEGEQEFTVVIYWEPRSDDNNWNVNNEKMVSDYEEGKTENALHIDFNITLAATQTPSEKDSFNKNYDKNATLGIEGVTETINLGAKDANAAIVEAIKKLIEEDPEADWLPEEGTDLTKIVYFDEDGLQENADGELAITLHFEGQDSINYVDQVYTAVKALIGNAVNQQAGSIYSVEIGAGLDINDPQVFNGQPLNEEIPGTWVENALRKVVSQVTRDQGLSGALEAAQEYGIAVEIIDMNGNHQTYRMNFELGWMGD